MKEDYKNPASGWNKSLFQEEVEGMQITVYQRPIEGSRTHMTRSDIVYKQVPIETFFELFNDYEKTFKEFDPKNQIKDFRFIEKTDKDSTVYCRIKMGALSSDRDMLIYSKGFVLPEGEYKDKLLIESNAVERDDVPEVAGVVRMVNNKV